MASAEGQAKRLRLAGVVQAKDLLTTFDLLQTSCWIAGASASAAYANVRRSTRDNPEFTSMVVAFVRNLANDFSFISVAIFDNIRAPPHVDERNDPHAYNLVIPLSDFQGGNIVVRSDDDLLSFHVANGPVAFQAAKHQHWVAPWTGRRTVLVAFTSRVAPLSPPDATFLSDLGFPLPLQPIDPRQPPPLSVSRIAKSKSNDPDVSPSGPKAPLHTCSSNLETPPVGLPDTSHDRPTFIEICAGSARLAHVMRAHHFQTFAIDHPGNQHKELHACLHMDLTDPAQQIICRDFIRSVGSLAALRMGLPCGTCSRARERALPRHLRGKFHRPMPLRNDRFPLGLPSLRGAPAARVASANQLYQFALSLRPDLLRAGVRVTIENPRRSWLWPVLKALARDMSPDVQTALRQLQPVHYDGCMHGGKRLKRSTLLASPGTFQDMGLECNGQHDHLPWSITPDDGKLRFDTASEAEYPQEFCHHYAECVLASLDAPPVPQVKMCPFANGPRKKAHPALIPEFRAIVDLPNPPPDTGQYRILSSSAGEIDKERNVDEAGTDQRRYKVGIRWDPLEFMHQAKKVTHPCDPAVILPPCLKAAIAKVLTSSPEEFAKSRLEAVATIRQMAGDLAKAEADLKKSLDPTVAKILKDKNFCLWKALLTASDYDDVGIVDSVASGINLVGSHGKVEAMDEDLRPAEITPEDLLSSAPLRRKLLKHQIKQHSASEQEDLTSTSKTEVELGDLQGPFSEQQVTEYFGSEEWLLNPRFPIYQGDSMKVRVIDDCKMSGMNTAFQRTFGVKPMDIDVLAAAAATIAKSIQDGEIDGQRFMMEPKVSGWVEP